MFYKIIIITLKCMVFQFCKKIEVRLRNFLVFFNNINIYYPITELNAIYDNFTNNFFRFLAINLFLKLNC